MIKIILKDGREFEYDCNMLDFIKISTKPKIYIYNDYKTINCFFVDEIKQILIFEKKKKKDKARLKDDVKALKKSVELQREAINALNERIETLEKKFVEWVDEEEKE